MKMLMSMFLFTYLATISGSALMADEPKAAKETKESAKTAAPAKENNEPAKTATSAKTEGYLGLTVGALHESLIAHLEHVLGKGGGGVLVEHVAKDSPAQRAGLRSHDILVAYNEHKVTNPDELVRLIHEGKPGQEVKLGIVRSGNREDAKATLGELPAASQHQSGQKGSHEPDLGVATVALVSHILAEPVPGGASQSQSLFLRWWPP